MRMKRTKKKRERRRMRRPMSSKVINGIQPWRLVSRGCLSPLIGSNLRLCEFFVEELIEPIPALSVRD